MNPIDILKKVEWSEEDRCFVGTCPDLMFGGVHGPDKEKVYRDLCKVVDEWVAVLIQEGEPLPPRTEGKVKGYWRESE